MAAVVRQFVTIPGPDPCCMSVLRSRDRGVAPAAASPPVYRPVFDPDRNIQYTFSAAMAPAASHRSVPRFGLYCSPTPRPKKKTTTASTNKRA